MPRAERAAGRRKASPRGYQDSYAPLARTAVPVTTRLQPRLDSHSRKISIPSARVLYRSCTRAGCGVVIGSRFAAGVNGLVWLR